MKATSVLLAALTLCSVPAAHAVGVITLINQAAGTQSLNRFDTGTPGASNLTAITGLGSGVSLLAIDYRPVTGQLWGLGSNSTLYTINTSTGAGSAVGSGLGVTLGNVNFGFDFNPVIDRIRIVGTDDTNTVGNPNDGLGTAVTAVFYPTGDANAGTNPNLVHHAYTNSAFGPAPASTQLYAIDSNLDILVTQANSAGTLGTVGSLGVDIGELGGFDIGGDGIAYGAFTSNAGVSTLYTINLATGAATSMGALSGTVTGFTVVPEPSMTAFLGLGAIALLRRKRRA